MHVCVCLTIILSYLWLATWCHLIGHILDGVDHVSLLVLAL